MLTEDQITDAAESHSVKYLHLEKISFFRGALWANNENAARIAELEAEIDRLNKKYSASLIRS